MLQWLVRISYFPITSFKSIGKLALPCDQLFFVQLLISVSDLSSSARWPFFRLPSPSAPNHDRIKKQTFFSSICFACLRPHFLLFFTFSLLFLTCKKFFVYWPPRSVTDDLGRAKFRSENSVLALNWHTFGRTSIEIPFRLNYGSIDHYDPLTMRWPMHSINFRFSLGLKTVRIATNGSVSEFLVRITWEAHADERLEVIHVDRQSAFVGVSIKIDSTAARVTSIRAPKSENSRSPMRFQGPIDAITHKHKRRWHKLVDFAQTPLFKRTELCFNLIIHLDGAANHEAHS